LIRTSPRRIREVVAWVGLSGREHTKVKTYSHGMRARLALAQALLPQPGLLILDEPSDGLDPEGIHEMRQTILRLHRELGLTIFLSSHFLNEVEQLCTRIAVLFEGRKVFEGSLSDIKRAQRWVRVRTNGFAQAAARLQEARLIGESRDEGLVALSEGVETDQVARALVAWEFPVYELTPQEQTLEAFYLSLMATAKQQPLNAETSSSERSTNKS